MKTPTHSLLLPAMIAGLAITNTHADPLAVGDKIGIDFGPTLTTNWNNITTNNAGVAAGSVIDLSGTIVDGVSITTSNAQFTNNDGSDNWVGLSTNGGQAPAEFVDSVTTDISGNFNLGDGRPYTVVVSGLDDALGYDLVAVTSAKFSPIDTVAVNGGTPSPISRPDAQANGLFHSFSGISTDGSGNLTITVVDTGASSNPILNGVLITAVVPPVVNRWALNGDGDWNTPANWSENNVPNGQSADAMLDSDGENITGPVTVTLDVPVTLGSLSFNHFEPYTVAGANALTFDNAGGGASVSVQSGNHEISVPVTMTEALAVTVATGGSLDLSGTLSDGGNAFDLKKSGAGNLMLSGDFSGFTGLTTINGGTVTLPRSGDYTLTHEFAGAGRLSFTGGGRVTLDPTSFNDHGGNDVSNGGTLMVGSAQGLGLGGVGFDNGTLEVGADIIAGTGGWIARAGGGVIEVGADLTLQGGGLTGTGAINKTGEGTWRILPGGGGVSIGTLTVTAGTLDLDRNDTFGNHFGSTQHLVIEAGALVTNGILVNRGYNTFRDVTLDGGELRVTGTARALADGGLFKFEAYGIRDSLTVTGTAASLITNPGAVANAGINIGGVTDLGDGVGSDLTFAVADVTGDGTTDLTVSAVLKNNYIGAAGFPPLSNGLCKTGAGTLQLTSANAYTGKTSVEEGTLILDQAFLADAADVELTSGATLQLDFAGSDMIDQLFIDDVGQATGTWGRTGHPTADHTTGLITGDGLLEVTTEPPVGYAGWASGFLPAFTDPDPGLDFDNDGLASGVEWVVDGDPTANDASAAAPTFDNITDPDDFLFIFRRRDDAATDPNTIIVVEYGSDLGGWTPAEAAWITVDDNGFGTSAIDGVGVDKVTVAIPRTFAVGGKLFARLRVTVVTP